MNFRASQSETAQQWLGTVLGLVQADLPIRFSGLGIIFYIPPLDLPVAPLVPTNQVPRLSRGDPEETAILLRALSDSATAMHDGFHLVDATSFAITHVCQFFAPPIPETIPKSVPQHPVGARFMSALLGSLLPSVIMTAVFGKEGAIIFERGTPRRFDIP